MDILQSLILGAIQGITEFLPISSSGHLVLVPYIFNWQYNGLSFDVALHFGTAIAIVAFFWRDWILIFGNAISSKIHVISSPEGDPLGRAERSPDKNTYPDNFLWQVVVASIPAAIVGYFLDDYVESRFHSPLLIALDLAVFGIILWLVDKYSKKNYNVKNIGYTRSFIVGIAQAFALIPGVSRSGITMVASRGLGLDREQAARFSFLLGTPAMIGAFIFKLKDAQAELFNAPFVLAVIASAVFGFLAIKYLLQYLKRGNFLIFTVYRIVLAAVVIGLYLIR